MFVLLSILSYPFNPNYLRNEHLLSQKSAQLFWGKLLALLAWRGKKFMDIKNTANIIDLF
jgi:hypothetical protein